MDTPLGPQHLVVEGTIFDSAHPREAGWQTTFEPETLQLTPGILREFSIRIARPWNVTGHITEACAVVVAHHRRRRHGVGAGRAASAPCPGLAGHPRDAAGLHEAATQALRRATGPG